MNKIFFSIIIFIIFIFGFLQNVNATGLDSTWHIIDRTVDNNYKIFKGTPFKFSFYNKLYNYYRITDDGAIVFGISPDNNNVDEGQYVLDKDTAYIKVKPSSSTDITISINKTKLVIPSGINYVNINGQFKVSDGVTPISIRAGTKFELKNGEKLETKSGLHGIKIDDKSAIAEIKNNINYTASGVDTYVMISPGFINLDTSDKDNKGHGVYEKEYHDSKGKLYAIGYMWYGYIEDTQKEVQYGVVLYNSTYYNNIRLFYGNIDSTINTHVFVGISNGNTADRIDTAYSNQRLGDLSNKDDILIDGSKIYQELVFPLGYEPDSLDPNKDLVIDYQERQETSPYSFLDKPHSRYALKFKVKINTDKTVCQREYVSSAGGDTLRWGKKDSNRADFDDIDTFCFVAETPGIVILDNASYAKGGYKVGQSECVVNHLSLMGFNAQTIGWNSNTTNNCWLTYKIVDSAKDLSIEQDSPYNILSKFLDEVDIRPVDTSKVINNQRIVFGSPKPLLIEQAGTKKEMNIIDSHFIPTEIDMVNSKTVYMTGTNGTDTYILYSSNRGDSWKIIKKVNGKKFEALSILDNTILVFFTDGTYLRNIESGFGEWKLKTLEGYSTINDIGIISNRRAIIVGNNGKMWKTFSAGDMFEKVDAKALYNLQGGENLQSIDIYGSSDIWISTNRGNILYSKNAGDTFYKKTTGSSMEYMLEQFEDGNQVYKNKFNENTIGNNLSYIDKDNSKSIKFANDYQYLKGCIDWVNKGNTYLEDGDNITNLEPYTVNLYDKYYPKGDLYFEYFIDTKDKVKPLKTLKLEDNYGNYILVNVKKILDDQGVVQQIGWNKVKVEIRDYESPYYVLSAPSTSSDTIEHFQTISKYYLSDTTIPLTGNERIGLGKISFAPSTNLSNIVEVMTFDNVLTNTNTRTCKINPSKNYLSLIDGTFNLKSFSNSDGEVKGFLSLDIYIKDSSKWNINSISLGNDINKNIKWNNIKQFSSLGIDTINNGWNTFVLPFNEANSSNIQYTNKKDINWEHLSYFTIKGNNENDTTYNKYALDNIRYSSVANTNLKFIKFFNLKDGLAFDDSNTYITNNNNTWGMNGTFSRGNGTNMSFKKVIKTRGREVYAIGNDNQGWFSYFTLDKGKNNKIYFSDSNIKLNTFDIINYNDGLGISNNGTIYEFGLETE